MEEIRTNMSKEDVVRNMLELAGHLVEQEEEVDEIEVKVKDLNMYFKAWRDEKQREEKRYDKSRNHRFHRLCRR